jgi:hypothetical protein
METSDFDFWIRDDRLAFPSPAIYCLASFEFSAAYIGQTNSKLGVLGRYSQHLSYTNSNTFKQRVAAMEKQESVNLGEVFGSFYELPKYKRYTNSSTDYREAVEALVQYNLINSFALSGLGVVSRVTKNPLCNNDEVKRIATKATLKFEKFLKSF